MDKKQTFKQQCIAVTHAVMAQQSLNGFIPKKCKTSFDLSTNMASEVISEHLILKISDSSGLLIYKARSKHVSGLFNMYHGMVWFIQGSCKQEIKCSQVLYSLVLPQ